MQPIRRSDRESLVTEGRTEQSELRLFLQTLCFQWSQ